MTRSNLHSPPRDSTLELLKGVCTVSSMLHISPQPCQSDSSSEDWDGKKAKTNEQRSLIDFKLLEQQFQSALQDTTQDTTKDTTQDVVTDKQEMDLINGMQD